MSPAHVGLGRAALALGDATSAKMHLNLASIATPVGAADQATLILATAELLAAEGAVERAVELLAFLARWTGSALGDQRRRPGTALWSKSPLARYGLRRRGGARSVPPRRRDNRTACERLLTNRRQALASELRGLSTGGVGLFPLDDELGLLPGSLTSSLQEDLVHLGV